MYEGKIPLEQVAEIQTSWDFAEGTLSYFEHLKAQQDSVAQLEKKKMLVMLINFKVFPRKLHKKKKSSVKQNWIWL